MPPIVAGGCHTGPVGIGSIESADEERHGWVELTPSQLRTLEELRKTGEPLVFPPDEIDELVNEARDAVHQLTARVGPDGHIVATKHGVTSALGCERLHVTERPFEWSVRNARGSVAHRAIELMLNWRGDPEPADLVDEAIARLAEDESGLGDFVAGLSPGDEADLRGGALDSVTHFVESFPPLDKRWRPVVESTIRWPVAGAIQLRGKVDLVIGPPRGAESTKVLIDLKTGNTAEVHRHDLRFYALIETLVRGVPPRKLASFYLDAGEPITEDVTMPLLRSALARTIHALDQMVALELERRPPTTSPGWPCTWCPHSDDCDDGRAWLYERDRV
jgi:hypothetical protein